jgi:hypothetical protein
MVCLAGRWGDGLLARFVTFFPWNRPNMRIACLLAGQEPPLYRWETWRNIVAAMTELADLLPRSKFSCCNSCFKERSENCETDEKQGVLEFGGKPKGP